MNNQPNNGSASPLDELKRINELIAKGEIKSAPSGSAGQAASNMPQAKPQVKHPVAPAQAQPQPRPAQAQPQARPVQAQPQARPAQAQPQARPAQAQPQARPVQAQPQSRPAQAQPQARPVQAQPHPRPAQAPAAVPVRPPVSAANSETRVTGAVREIQPPARVAAEPQRNDPRPNARASAAPAAAAAKRPARQAPAQEGKSGKKRRENGDAGKGILTNTVKAVIYIVCVLVVSGCLSLFIIFAGNDVFAFVKDSNEVTVTIPEGADIDDIADVLAESDVIRYPSLFKFYCKIRHKTADEYLFGSFTVSPSMPYDSLIATFKPSKGSRKETTITLIEGMDVDEIIDLFVEKGIGTREKFVDVIQNYDFDFWFVDELDKEIAANPDSGRIYRLEGYLFPDTYNFYTDSSEEEVIYKLLVNFDAKFDEDKRERAKELGMTCDEIVTLASIIQKEAKYISDYGTVSSVFHNRLNSNVTNGLLESNATVQYTMPDEEVRLELSKAEIDKYDSAYNTYLHKGLPVGAISNPSLNAINWALYPTDTNYYYFVSDAQGYNLYAATYNEHQANVAKVAAESGN